MNLTKKKVSWPVEYEVIPVASLAEILAEAVVPQQTDEAGVLLQLRLMEYSKSIKEAISLGELPIRDATTWEPLPAYADTAHTVVNAKEFKSYLERKGSVVELVIEPSQKRIIWKPKEQVIGLYALPSTLAAVMSGDAPDINDVEGFLDNDEDFGRYLQETEFVIDMAVEEGELPVRDPETYEICDVKDTDDPVVSIEDLQKYLKRTNSLTGLVIETASDSRPQALLTEVVKWNGQTYQPGPPLTDEEVEASRLEVEAIQEAEARSQAREQEAERERAKHNWWGVSSAYIVTVMQTHQCTTAKNLYYKLGELAGESSPFNRGEGANRGALVVKDLAQSVSLKTFQNNWQKIKEAALG